MKTIPVPRSISLDFTFLRTAHYWNYVNLNIIPKLSLLRAARRQPAIFRGRGRQVMHLPCKQVDMGALPIDSTISLRGTRLKHRGRSHKPFEAGVIPAPATNFREVIRLPVCKTGVFKQAGSDDWSITSTSHHFGLVAQSAERPVVCGRVEGATPFGSAISA